MQVPYFNAPIYLQNKQEVGRVEEVLGTITQPVSAPLPTTALMRDN